MSRFVNFARPLPEWGLGPRASPWRAASLRGGLCGLPHTSSYATQSVRGTARSR